MCNDSKKRRTFAKKIKVEKMTKKVHKPDTNPPKKESKKNNLTVKEWATEDRPREKLILKGKKELSNAELVALLIGSGTEGQSAVDLAKEILQKSDNSLSELSRKSIKELTHNFKGIGKAKAIGITAALELGYRMLGEQNSQNECYIHDSQDCFNYISPSLIDLPIEEFWAIYLNNKNKILFKQRISSGGITDTAVDLRKLFSIALEKNAVSIAVAHNHPSGDLTPSRKDKELTKRISDAGAILRISLLDHLIVGIERSRRPSFYSFHDNGLI